MASVLPRGLAHENQSQCTLPRWAARAGLLQSAAMAALTAAGLQLSCCTPRHLPAPAAWPHVQHPDRAAEARSARWSCMVCSASAAATVHALAHSQRQSAAGACWRCAALGQLSLQARSRPHRM